MDKAYKAALLRLNPERFATTGLSWSTSSHYDALANGLFQVLMMVLAQQQCEHQEDARRALRRQQGRIEQRLNVVERAAWRAKVQLPRPMDDAVLRYALEKMADAIEEGAAAWGGNDGRNVIPGAMLGVAVQFAATVRGHRAGERFSVGPFGGLSKISQLVTRPDVMLEMRDLPQLESLVEQAREIPLDELVTPEAAGSAAFMDAHGQLLAKLQDRDKRFGLSL